MSAAERSGHLNDGLLDGLFDFGHGNDPDWPADVYDQDEYYRMEMRRRSLALLLYAGDWSSTFTARAADAVTFQPAVTNNLHAYEGFTSGMALFDGHPELASSEWMAVSALARDDEAAHRYLAMDHFDDGWHDNLSVFVHITDATLPAQSNVAAGHLGISPDEFEERYFAAVAAVLEGGLFRHPLASGTTYSPDTTELITQMAQSAGEGRVLDEIKQVLARVSAPYTQDLAIATQADRRDLPPGRLELTVDEVSAFFEELSFDEQARATLATNAAAFLHGQIRGAGPDIAAGDPHAVGTETRLTIGLYVALGEAMHHAMHDVLAEREALVSAWRSVTDPLVDLVTGKIIERIPIVSTAADLPIIKNIVDGVTNTLDEAVNSAIYDNAIPRPEVERLSSWEAAMGPGVRDAIAGALYEDPPRGRRSRPPAGADRSTSFGRSTTCRTSSTSTARTSSTASTPRSPSTNCSTDQQRRVLARDDHFQRGQRSPEWVGSGFGDHDDALDVEDVDVAAVVAGDGADGDDDPRRVGDEWLDAAAVRRHLPDGVASLGGDEQRAVGARRDRGREEPGELLAAGSPAPGRGSGRSPRLRRRTRRSARGRGRAHRSRHRPRTRRPRAPRRRSGGESSAGTANGREAGQGRAGARVDESAGAVGDIRGAVLRDRDRRRVAVVGEPDEREVFERAVRDRNADDVVAEIADDGQIAFRRQRHARGELNGHDQPRRSEHRQPAVEGAAIDAPVAVQHVHGPVGGHRHGEEVLGVDLVRRGVLVVGRIAARAPADNPDRRSRLGRWTLRVVAARARRRPRRAGRQPILGAPSGTSSKLIDGCDCPRRRWRRPRPRRTARCGPSSCVLASDAEWLAATAGQLKDAPLGRLFQPTAPDSGHDVALMSEVTVGLDIGTTSVKAIAADGDGTVVARAAGPAPARGAGGRPHGARRRRGVAGRRPRRRTPR